ncbi:MAG: M48 family metallopeptidase [Gemmatales bacterium]|nr:M48 family metallopeptidase [Gemmatales bacterium]MDW8388409.1 M48 family metallopeptidase [Gemmatales bacterium]
MSTNFFQRQERARRNTTLLVVLFLMAVAAIIAVVYFPIWMLLASFQDQSSQYQPRHPPQPYRSEPPLERPYAPSSKTTTDSDRFSSTYPAPSPRFARPEYQADYDVQRSREQVREPEPVSLWNPLALAISAGLTGLIVGLGSLVKTSQLASGGKVIALQLGGEPLTMNTRDFREKRLLNVVEEMSIASGVPMPAVYVLRDEPGINAFAAGFTPEDAVIGVSQGCLDYLTRDELQGVIAHEFSHILNGDMRLNIRLIGLIYGLFVLSVVGYYTLYFFGRSAARSSSRSKGSQLVLVLLLIGLAFYLLGALGVFFGRIIQAAVSRQREFLADASAVQFTRNPDGIAGALKKIGGLRDGSVVHHPAAGELSHLFFADGLNRLFGSVFATHPPLPVRIRALDPHWDGKYPKVKKIELEPEPGPAAKPEQKPLTLPGMPQLPVPVVLGAVEVAALADQVGRPTDASRSAAAAFEEQIGPEIREALSDAFSAQAMLLAFLLDDDAEVRSQQLQVLRTKLGPELVDAVVHYGPWASVVSLGHRLAIAQLALPALRTMSQPQYLAFRSALEAMVRADNRIHFGEFALEMVLQKYLDRAFGVRPPRLRASERTAEVVREAVLCVLGTLAWQGHDTPEQAAKAFTDALRQWQPEAKAALPERTSCTMSRFREAIELLENARPTVKQRLMEAAAAAVSSDGQVTEREYALLRVICAALDCPLPMLANT